MVPADDLPLTTAGLAPWPLGVHQLPGDSFPSLDPFWRGKGASLCPHWN